MSTRTATTSATTALTGARVLAYVPMPAGAVAGNPWHVASTTASRVWIFDAKCHRRRPEEVASQR